MTRKRYTNTPPTNGKHLYLSREERFARFGRVVGERRDSGRRVGHLDFDDSCADCGHHVCSCDRGESELCRDSSQELESSAIDFEHNGQPFRARYNGYSWLVTRRPDTGKGYVILVGGKPSHYMLHYGAKGYLECHGDDTATRRTSLANLPPRGTVYDAIADALGYKGPDAFEREGWAWVEKPIAGMSRCFRGVSLIDGAKRWGGLTARTMAGKAFEHEVRVLAAERAE